MISMGAFVASGGMETLRYHAIAVKIGDLLVDEEDDQTFFVDFRFRFISEQARTFFVKQYCGDNVGESGPEVKHIIYPKPKKLVSLFSDDPRQASDDVISPEGAIKPLEKLKSGQKGERYRVKNSSRHKHVRIYTPERRRQDLHEGRKGKQLGKAMYLQDTMWIARTEALSTILGSHTDAVETHTSKLKNDAETSTENPDHTSETSYSSDSKYDSASQASCDLSDNEFSFIGPRSRRSSLVETRDSVELTRNYWKRNHSLQKSASEENSGDAFPSREQEKKES